MTYSYLNIQKQKTNKYLTTSNTKNQQLHLSETPIQATGQGIILQVQYFTKSTRVVERSALKHAKNPINCMGLTRVLK